MGQNLKPKPKTAVKFPVSDQPSEEFISLVAQIVLRIISDPSSKMLLKPGRIEDPREINLISIEEAAEIRGVADSQTFQTLSARQNENPDMKILFLCKCTDNGFVFPATS